LKAAVQAPPEEAQIDLAEAALRARFGAAR